MMSFRVLVRLSAPVAAQLHSASPQKRMILRQSQRSIAALIDRWSLCGVSWRWSTVYSRKTVIAPHTMSGHNCTSTHLTRSQWWSPGASGGETIQTWVPIVQSFVHTIYYLDGVID